LPYAYLAIAMSLIILNIGYEKLEHKLTPIMLLKYIIIISAIVLVFIMAGFSFADNRTFVFILLVWGSLFYMVTGYAYWGLVSLLFNVRESKRVFSVIGSGDIPAKLIGYLCAPLFIPFIGIQNLLWLAIGSLLLAFLFFQYMEKKYKWEEAIAEEHRSEEHHEKLLHEQHPGLGKILLKNNLIFAISLLAIVSYNVYNFIDFTFLAHVKHRFEDIADLAKFIAIFFAIGRVLALVMKLGFSSRVIERLGIITCLFITPVILFICCVLFLLLGDQTNYTLYVFGIMVLIAEVLRSTIQEPVFFILFQPLKEQLRLKGHLISKGYMLPPSFIIVGVSLIAMHQLKGEISIALTIKILLLNLVVWAGVIFLIRKAYLKTLHNSISKGVFSSDDIYLKDTATINILLNKIQLGKKTEVIFALKLLENAEYEKVQELLIKQLQSKHKEIRMYVLDRLTNRNDLPKQAIHDLVETEQDIDVKQKIVEVLCKHDNVFLSTMAEQLDGLEPPLQKIVIISLLNQHEFTYLFKAGAELNKLIESEVTEQKILALEIISELQNVKFSDEIEKLISDKELVVRRSAIITACKLNIKKLLPEIIEMLNDPADKFIALQGLQQYGDELFLDIEKLPDEKQHKYLPEMLRLAGKVKGLNSTQFLLKFSNKNQEHSDKIVHSLWLKDYMPENASETQVLETLLHNCMAMAKKKLNYFYEVPFQKNYTILKHSLHQEVKTDITTSIKLCAMLHDKHGFNRILELIDNEDKQKLYNGMEMIELLLPAKTARELNHLFDHMLDPAFDKTPQSAHDAYSFLNKIVFKYASSFNPWTKSVCMYSSWQNKEMAFLSDLATKPLNEDALIIKETKNYILTETT
jgi:hypothetical protein